MSPIYKVEPKNDIPPALASKVTWGKLQFLLSLQHLPTTSHGNNHLTLHTCLQHEAIWVTQNPLNRS